MPPTPITPAEIAWTANRTPYSPRYNDVYHATAGGLAQAKHVFLDGNGLPGRWARRERFVILETGFGQGLNFLATWAAWRDDPQACNRLFFLSVEKHPFTRDDLTRLHGAYPEVANLSAELRDAWPELTSGFHRLEFAGGRIVLILAFADAMAAIPQFVASPDAVFLDGFAPARNPELWSPRLLSEIGLMCGPQTTLATWAVGAAVRDALSAAGFKLEKRPGFAHKREMLTGRMSGDLSENLQVPVKPEKNIIVVGAGLAGATVAERLCARGFTVDLFERRHVPAAETSSNLTAVMLPMLSLDDNRTSRLNRACYLHALRVARVWRQEGHAIDGEFCGVLQIPRDEASLQKQPELLARCGFPPSYARQVDAEEAGALVGARCAEGGIWFGGGAWWNPPSLCRTALERAGHRLTTHFGAEASALSFDDGKWTVFDAQGRALAKAENVVLASAHDLLRMPQTAHLPLFRFRGQVAHLAAPASATLKAVVCKEGYVSPAYAGFHCVGASFHRNGEQALRESDHLANIGRLDAMLPDYLDGALPGARQAPMAGRVGFRPVSPDKLPILGQMYRPEATPRGRDLSAVERWPGLHVATGFGARGLVWSFLMADLLAANLAGDPLPLESDLAAIVDPARFLLRKRDA